MSVGAEVSNYSHLIIGMCAYTTAPSNHLILTVVRLAIAPHDGRLCALVELAQPRHDLGVLPLDEAVALEIALHQEGPTFSKSSSQRAWAMPSSLTQWAARTRR